MIRRCSIIVLAVILIGSPTPCAFGQDPVPSEEVFLNREFTKWQVAFSKARRTADTAEWEAFRDLLVRTLRERTVTSVTVQKMRVFAPADPCWNRGDDRGVLFDALRVWAFGSDERKVIVNQARQLVTEDAEQAVALRIEALEAAKKQASQALFDAMRLRLECATRLPETDERRDELLQPLVTLYGRHSWLYDVGNYNPHLRIRSRELFMQAVVLWANSHPPKEDAIAIPIYMYVPSQLVFEELPDDFAKASSHYQSEGLAQFKADVFGAQCALNWLVDNGIKSDHDRMVLREALKLMEQYAADVKSVHNGSLLMYQSQPYYMRDVIGTQRY